VKDHSPQTAEPTTRASGWRGWPLFVGMLCAVLAVVLAIYWPALSAGALYMDDKFYLGPTTRHPSWASAKAIFGEVLSPSMVNGYYQPLSLLSIMLDFLDPRATTSLLPFHRTSLVLHLANVALIVLLLYALFRKSVTAAMLGMLWGVHPLNADAILWIAERKTVLSTTFALGSLLCYVAYARHADRTGRGDWKRYGAALLAYVCAVLSKPTTLPVVLLLPLLDYWPLGRPVRKKWLEKLPFALICVLSATVTVISQAQAGDGGHAQLMKPHYLPLVTGYSLGFYLLKLVWPTGLVSDYLAPQPFGLGNPQVLGATIVALGAVAAVVLSARRNRAWLSGGLFLVISVLPTFGIVRFTSAVTANRSLYLPMVGLLLPLAWELGRWWNGEHGETSATAARALPAAVVATLAIASASVTRGYQSHWQSSVGLLQYYISQKPSDGKFHTRLGNEWIARGDYPAAIVEFRTAARLNPRWTENHLNLGRALFTVGDYGEAEPAFATALQQTPNDWRAHMLMGMTLERRQDSKAALREFRAASKLAPNAAQPHFHIAQILAAQGDVEMAAEEYRRTLVLEPRFADAQRALDQIEAGKP
jgi:protein O-mannosyl-transferase